MYFADLNYFVLGYSLTEYRFKRTNYKTYNNIYLLIWNFNDYTNNYNINNKYITDRR